MRIVHYASSISQSAGGLFYSVSGLAKAQRALGAEVTIVGGADTTFEEDKFIWEDLPIHTFRLRGKDAYSFSPRIAWLLVKLRPDILHIHGIWSETSVYGRIASGMGVPTVCSPRGMLDPWIVGRRSTVKRVHGALFERPFLRHSGIHALNSSEESSVRAFFAPHPVTTFVVPNGVDLPPRPPEGARSGALYLGRLHEKKQVLELIRNWQAQDALAPISLTVAGWGDPAYEAEVARLCEAAANIHFVGRAYGKVKAALLAQHQWFILPSLSEGLPMAVLEAMAAGCIPVMTRECNLPELIESGSAVSMQTDFSDFSDVAQRLATCSSEAIAALSQQVQHDVQAFAWPSVARRVLDGYQSYLRGRGR
jgi:poly(glycerol-phosphate) alpha-glucosyltransferase